MRCINEMIVADEARKRPPTAGDGKDAAAGAGTAAAEEEPLYGKPKEAPKEPDIYRALRPLTLAGAHGEVEVSEVEAEAETAGVQEGAAEGGEEGADALAQIEGGEDGEGEEGKEGEDAGAEEEGEVEDKEGEVEAGAKGADVLGEEPNSAVVPVDDVSLPPEEEEEPLSDVEDSDDEGLLPGEKAQVL